MEKEKDDQIKLQQPPQYLLYMSNIEIMDEKHPPLVYYKYQDIKDDLVIRIQIDTQIKHGFQDLFSIQQKIQNQNQICFLLKLFSEYHICFEFKHYRGKYAIEVKDYDKENVLLNGITAMIKLQANDEIDMFLKCHIQLKKYEGTLVQSSSNMGLKVPLYLDLNKFIFSKMKDI